MSDLKCVVVAILLALLATSDFVLAQAPRPPAQAVESSVWITRIEPPISVTLTPGSTVQFLVEAEYTLADANGRLALFIQGAEPENARIAADVKPITRGSNKVSFVVDVKIPPTRHVDVITALYSGSNGPTQVTDSRVFEVHRVQEK